MEKKTITPGIRMRIAASRHMRQELARMKDHAKNLMDDGVETPDEYAIDRTRYAAEDAAYGMKGTAQSALRRLHRRRDMLQRREGAVNGTPDVSDVFESSPEPMEKPFTGQRRTASPRAHRHWRPLTSDASTRTPGFAPSTGSSGYNREMRKSAIIRMQKTAQNAKRAAQTQRAARNANYSGEAAAKATEKTASAVARAVEAVIEGLERLTAALTAGGGAAVAVVVVLCIIGLLVSSVFGIFFAGEDTGSGTSVRDAIRTINSEYTGRIDEIKVGVQYDELVLPDKRPAWREILAVYAVRTVNDPDHPQEVTSMTEEKTELLRDTFWQMNALSSRTETVALAPEPGPNDAEPGNGGNPGEPEDPNPEDPADPENPEVAPVSTHLYIELTQKTPEDMAAQLSFTETQQQQLSELLSEEYATLWNGALYGIGTGDGEIVSVALSQVGNVGGEPYWSYMGFTSRVDWCACFVSWCGNECGYIESGVMPNFSWCETGVNWFKDRNQWLDPGATPAPGDIIFFDWDNNGDPDHVGIVEKVEDGYVYTIEGNSGNAVRENNYLFDSESIYGYGTLLIAVVSGS